MSSVPIAGTAEVLRGATPATIASLSPGRTRAAVAALTDWLVRLTERAHRHMARAALADALRSGALPLDAGRFLTDASGGGSRGAEAARALRAPARS